MKLLLLISFIAASTLLTGCGIVRNMFGPERPEMFDVAEQAIFMRSFGLQSTANIRGVQATNARRVYPAIEPIQ